MQVHPVGGGFAPSTAAPAAAARSPTSASDPAADFMAYLSKSPAQRMRDEIMRELGVSEDELKAMNPEQRAKIEEKVKELVRQKVQEQTEKNTGVYIDLKA
jgi:TPP-dependent pyruvate/acetoin dehydrogenase alpha subunit